MKLAAVLAGVLVSVLAAWLTARSRRAELFCEDPQFGPAPSWAVKDAFFPGVHLRNAKIVSDANRAGQCFDFLLYGDSITMFHDKDPSVFKKHFGDLRAAALGIGGARIEDLAWRLTSDAPTAERPAKAPKVLAIMIGVNSLTKHTAGNAAARLEELVRWLKAAYPTTKIVIMSVLKNLFNDVASLNRQYAAVAAKTGSRFVSCGSDIDHRNKALMPDGLHPSAQGHDQILGCLRPIVNQLMGGAITKQASPKAPVPGTRG